MNDAAIFLPVPGPVGTVLEHFDERERGYLHRLSRVHGGHVLARRRKGHCPSSQQLFQVHPLRHYSRLVYDYFIILITIQLCPAHAPEKPIPHSS